ncbi:MAG: LapA family protein [Deltaproteobacteria bacterium]|nr:LapA family protein [Deltaproteobacteria bacterium]
MKKIKLVFWLILIAFLALLTYQNWDYFMSQHGLRINLFVAEYHTPPLQNAVLLLIFFFAGLLIAYFFTLFERFKSKRTIKSMTASLEMSEKLLDELKKEIQTLKGEPPTPQPPADEASPDHETKDPDVS